MFVFGIDIPLPEILFIALVLLTAAIIFIVIQMRHMNRHMRILEDTTLEIRKYEEEEMQQVRRFEMDMKKLESDEAELFISRIVPTVAKLENYVAIELLKSKQPEAIRGDLVKKGINATLATKVVNGMTYYMDFFKKLPKKRVDSHLTTASKMPLPKK